MAIQDFIAVFFWNVTPEIFLFIQKKHVIPTETGDASLPSISLQNLTSFVSAELPWIPTTSRFIAVHMSKPLLDVFWNATPTDKICTHHAALVSISSGLSSLNATNHHFSLEWLILLLVVLSIYFKSNANNMVSIPTSVASTYCAIDIGSIASYEVNDDENAGILDDLSSYSFLFGIDDDDDDDSVGSSLCYSLDSDGIDIDVDSLCYSVGDGGDDGDSLSIFSYGSSAASVLPVAECSVPRRYSARIAAMDHVCYKKFF